MIADTPDIWNANGIIVDNVLGSKRRLYLWPVFLDPGPGVGCVGFVADKKNILSTCFKFDFKKSALI